MNSIVGRMVLRQRLLGACATFQVDACDDENTIVQPMRNEGKERPYRLLDYDACPEYLKDNEFILSYYRAEFSFSRAFSSLFRWHNETINIWTHLLGFLLFLSLTLVAVYEVGHLPIFSRCVQGLGLNKSEHCLLGTMKFDVARTMGLLTDRATRWPFFVFMAGSMFCLLASTICHLFTCHSEPLAILLMRIDYAGIATMIATSFYPPIYYVFQCKPIWQWVYLSTISIMGTMTLGALFAPALQDGKYRAFRALLFMSMGASGVIPAVHALVTQWKEPLLPVIVALEMGMASCYCIGTVIYIIRVPERWKPGCFDLGGHSHNLFHVLVIGGAYFHYRAALIFLQWREHSFCT